MDIPADLRFTKNDQWIRVEGDAVTIGITDYAQDQLSDIVYVEINPGEGDTLEQGDAFGTVESVKAAADVYMPVGGTVTAVNDLLEDTPEVINDDPYGQAWMIKITVSDSSQIDGLMDAAAYTTFHSE